MTVSENQRGLLPVWENRIFSIASVCAKWLAIAGGLVLIAVGTTTVISVIGRALIDYGLQPINGDFELVEMGCAIAVFSFLPWCTIKGGHATVDVFVARAHPVFKSALSISSYLLMSVVAIIVGLQFYEGLLEKMSYGETTFLLELPVWYGYVLCMPGIVLFIATSVVGVWHHVNRALNGGEETTA